MRVDLAQVGSGPIDTIGTVAASAPMLADVDFRLAAAVAVTGRLTESGPGRYYWHGRLRTAVAASCRRCLVPVPVDVAAEVRVLFTEDATADDPSAYVIPRGAREIDLDATIREELILAVPTYVLCREECRGLCARCGKDLNEGPCDCRRDPDPRWAALEALRSRGGDETR